jgi:predicted small secreted protein
MIRAALPAAVLAAGLVLTGCSTTETAIGAGTATALAQEVRHIAVLAAAHRYPAALTAATSLRGDLRAAVDTGRVSGDRATRIRSALALVETDLRTAQRTAIPTPSPTATSTTTPTPTPTDTPIATPTPTRTAAPATRTAAPKPAPLRLWKQHGKKGWGGKGKDG